MQKLNRFAFILSCLIIILNACQSNTSKPVVANAVTVDTVAIDTARFLSLFQRVEFDSLNISSYSDSIKILAGKVIDTSYDALLPDSFKSPSQHVMRSIDNIYALKSFSLDDRYDGYLVVHPGEYVASQVSLLIFDKKAKRFVNDNVMIAENFGDAGDVYYLQSTLKRNKDGSLHILLNLQTDMGIADDTSLVDSAQSGMLLYQDAMREDIVSSGKLTTGKFAVQKHWFERDPLENL